MTASSPNDNDEFVLRDDHQGIASLTIHRPQAYNALSLGCMQALIRSFDSLERDPNVVVVILKGSGKGFCAGHDLKELRSNPQRAFYDKTFSTCSSLMQRIVSLSKPVIAQVHGVATAAGCQLVASCDLAIAEQGARFATPGVNIGLFCSTPMVALSRNVSRKHAMEMLLTGDMISADKACEIGLINQATPSEELAQTTLSLAQKIAGKSPLTLKIGKQAFYHQLEQNLGSAYEYCGRIMTENMLAQDAAEGISALLDKRQPVWRGK